MLPIQVEAAKGKNPKLTIRSGGRVTLKVPAAMAGDHDRLVRFAEWVAAQVGESEFTLRSTIGKPDGVHYKVHLSTFSKKPGGMFVEP